MGPIISPWPKLCGSEMGNPYGAHIYAHMRPIWVLVGHVGWENDNAAPNSTNGRYNQAETALIVDLKTHINQLQ